MAGNAQGRTGQRGGIAVLWVLSVLIALGSYRFLVADLALVMEPMLHHLQDRPLALYLHIGVAPIALLLLPLQFSKHLRQARPGLHRWLGRLYGLVILVSGLAGFVLALTTEEGRFAAVGLALLSLAWLFTTARAILFALNRDFARHRAWMFRSAALTLAGVTLRLYLPVGLFTVGFEASYPLICWLCWVPNLLFAEWLLRRRPAGRWAQPA
ncbi:DUF2306 domain-containing protein [Ruegeria aquimaris]|uniref:DUF2306 domain-containing protein n=1 Tax=Ruegeria aquimaris TaxID=2984333 RepID=A0ABT3AJT4_9RHOB|nr:DUF2306 domain-containing protein [Ruegeria sp. XHP0148]MCV2888842.1 DUF2306 domain-containing protein [Ruegeria sp. XHP0148]